MAGAGAAPVMDGALRPIVGGRRSVSNQLTVTPLRSARLPPLLGHPRRRFLPSRSAALFPRLDLTGVVPGIPLLADFGATFAPPPQLAGTGSDHMQMCRPGPARIRAGSVVTPTVVT